MMIEPAQPPFALFPEARHWWSLTDYGAVLGVMRAVQPKTVLEFGPGGSTLALLEGGAALIDTCEDDPHWRQVHQARIQPGPGQALTFHAYVAGDPIVVPTLTQERYDLAFIDGPKDSTKRAPVVEFCVARAKAVLVPTEDSASRGPNLRAFLNDLAQRHGMSVEFMETGPLAGGFALLTRQTDVGVIAEGPASPDEPGLVKADVHLVRYGSGKGRRGRKAKHQEPGA